jgi:anti-sigma factor ChrR (cupin superfamily)
VTTDESWEQVREHAALYALGGLDAGEAAAFEAHLASGDARYREALAECRAVVDDLAYAAAPRAPQEAARERVLARIRAERPAGVVERDGIRVVRGGQVAWEPSALPGVDFKLLREDAVSGRRTGLIRMAPGAAYPRHRHPEMEEVILLEGDLMVNGVLMLPGDYCSAESRSIHEQVYSPSGCVFLVTAGANEFL